MTKEEAVKILEPFKACMYDQHGCPISDVAIALDVAIEALKAQQWIPITTRPMTKEELEYYEDHWGCVIGEPYAVMFTCEMPLDQQSVWVCTKGGTVFQDVCEADDGYTGLEGNGDWQDIIAWMPVNIPKPYGKERTNVNKRSI